MKIKKILNELRLVIVRIIKILFVLFMLLVSYLLITGIMSKLKYMDLDIISYGYYGNIHNYGFGYISIIYNNENFPDTKVEKNLYYTFMVNNKYFKLKEISYTSLLNLSNAKLIKKGKRCFIYKFPIKYLVNIKLYKYLQKHNVDLSSYIVGNYDSGKKCGKGDYEKCNMYITEKGVLKYNDSYKCE